MNKNDTLKWLLTYFEPFEVHEHMINELAKIISKTGYVQRFFTLLIARLLYLDCMGKSAIKHKEFERVNENLYSMHLTGTDFNIRILYTFSNDDTPVLLLSFYERAGKRVTDYSLHLDLAKERFEEMELYNGE